MACVVIDAGAAAVRVGWAGDDGPMEVLEGGTSLKAALEALEAEPSEVAVVLSEAPGAPAAERAASAAALFSLGVPCLYISSAPLLALLHTGMDTGVAIDVGATATSILPLFDGHPILGAAARVPLGGSHLPDRTSCDGLFDVDADVAGAVLGVHDALLPLEEISSRTEASATALAAFIRSQRRYYSDIRCS